MNADCITSVNSLRHITGTFLHRQYGLSRVHSLCARCWRNSKLPAHRYDTLRHVFLLGSQQVFAAIEASITTVVLVSFYLKARWQQCGLRDGHCHFVYLCCSAFAQEAAPAIVIGETEHEAPVGMMGGLGDTIGLRPYVEAVCCLSMPSEFCASVQQPFSFARLMPVAMARLSTASCKF